MGDAAWTKSDFLRCQLNACGESAMNGLSIRYEGL